MREGRHGGGGIPASEGTHLCPPLFITLFLIQSSSGALVKLALPFSQKSPHAF